MSGGEVNGCELRTVNTGPLSGVEHFAILNIVNENLPMIEMPFEDETQTLEHRFQFLAGVHLDSIADGQP
ncbi:MAG TPA: hypothetical protein VN736_01275 [Candidatus Limnocylindrales bacterium]|nr:hypothetical protein [Candidatus Limnocylindrales bacterium]